MSQSLTRKLSARRGSVSAPDPLGKNVGLNYDPNRSSSSTLTIVRVVTDPASSASLVVTPLNLSDSSSSPIQHRRSLRRHGSTSGSSPAENRLSFAFTSFSPISPPQTPISHLSTGPQNHTSRTASSPSSSPRLRPSSPQFTRRNSGSGGSAFSKPNLTPEQLVDLARQSSAPRYVPGTMPVSNSNHSDITTTSISSPTTFTILPADVYLPFVDRAAETAHLLSTSPTKKLLSLLAQTFQTQIFSQETQDPFTVDPTRWTFATLHRWLTEVDRSSASDAVWVRQARKCVLAHSELIWERLKGALGVPPELEQEDMNTDPTDIMLSATEDEGVQESSDNSFPLTSSPEQSVVIEPILATSSSILPPSTPGTSNPPPSSLPANLSHHGDLQDIVEDGEEEEESGDHTGEDDCTKSRDDSEAQIHGLRVCTSPVPPSSVTPHVLSYPPSPTMSMNFSGRDSAEPRSPDFSQPPLSRRLSRTSSHGSISSIARSLSGSYVYRDFGNNSTSEIGDSESERAYDPVGDRVPGNPLFPSNFARLALGPTLRANNPSLRGSSHAATPRWARWAPGSRPPSWFEGWDGVKQEYAATAASGSSVGAGDTE